MRTLAEALDLAIPNPTLHMLLFLGIKPMSFCLFFYVILFIYFLLFIYVYGFLCNYRFVFMLFLFFSFLFLYVSYVCFKVPRIVVV